MKKGYTYTFWRELYICPSCGFGHNEPIYPHKGCRECGQRHTVIAPNGAIRRADPKLLTRVLGWITGRDVSTFYEGRRM